MSSPAEQLQLPQAQSVALPKRWPLVSKLQARNPNTPLTKDARLINCYAEYDAEDKEYFIYKRLGLSTAAAFTSPHVYGAGMYTHAASGKLAYVTQDNTAATGYLYVPSVSAGSLASMTLPTSSPGAACSFESMNNTNQAIVVATGLSAWIFSITSGLATQVTDPNYPNYTVPGLVYLDGTLYVMDAQGGIHGSALNDASTWPALNLINASSNSDSGMALAKQLNYVIALKQYTTQIFYDAGNSTGSPLSPVPDAQIPLGCHAMFSVQGIDNVLLWVTSNNTVSPQVVRLDNLTPKIVSTPAVERVLDNLFFLNNYLGASTPQIGLFSWVLKHGGHRLYGITSTPNNITLVYDLDQDLWYLWQDFAGNFWPVFSMAYAPPTSGVQGIHYAQHRSNGNIYQLDGAYAYPNDFGNVFPVDIYTPNMDFGTVRRKTVKALYFNGDKVPSVLRVRHSDDDYQTWSNFRTVDLNRKKPRLGDEGTFDRRRAYHLRHQANSDFRLKTIDLQMDLGTL